MNKHIEKSMALCNQITDLLEQDYYEILKSLDGEIYDEYKLLVLDEIERVEIIKQKLKAIGLQFI